MYDQAGSVLRIETVMSEEEFRVRRRVHRNGRPVMAWAPQGTRKSVAYLFRYREVALAANARVLDALAQVDDPTAALRELDAMTTRRHPVGTVGRSIRPFAPLARADREIFQALLAGEHVIVGFKNCDLRDRLRGTSVPMGDRLTRQRVRTSRLLARLHAYGLVAKIPRSRRWKVSAAGYGLTSASLRLRDVDFPARHAAAAS